MLCRKNTRRKKLCCEAEGVCPSACVGWVERSTPNKINEDGSAVLDPSYVCFSREEDKEIETLIRKVILTGRPLGAERPKEKKK